MQQPSCGGAGSGPRHATTTEGRASASALPSLLPHGTDPLGRGPIRSRTGALGSGHRHHWALTPTGGSATATGGSATATG